MDEPAATPTATQPTADTFDLAQIDGTRWCSAHRGDCVEIALPEIIAFNGRTSGSWRPQPADPDGCYRLRGPASYDLWFCPAGTVADMASRPTGLDDTRSDVDRLIVKFKGLDGWVYLRSE